MKTIVCAVGVLVAYQAAPPTFRSGVELVQIDVSVIRDGQPVRGLTSRDFSVTDNGVPQEIDSVTLDRLPLSVQLVLDTSGSVSGDRLMHLIQAGNGLLAALHSEDRVGLITFSHAIDIRMAMTNNVGSVRAALANAAGEGGTSLRDAVQLALELRPIDHTRPLLLVFTDGRDTTSWLSDEAAAESARRSGMVTHVVKVRSRDDLDSMVFLKQLVEATGGRIWSASSSSDLDQLFTRALDEMRARYLLTFSTRGVARAGWHELKVKLKNGRANITARQGYSVERPTLSPRSSLEIVQPDAT
jgi:Ca-activated chloride channel family protein